MEFLGQAGGLHAEGGAEGGQRRGSEAPASVWKPRPGSAGGDAGSQTANVTCDPELPNSQKEYTLRSTHLRGTHLGVHT